MDLSEIVAQVVSSGAGMIDKAQADNPGRPIEITLHWHAGSGKLEMFIRPVIHLSTWRARHADVDSGRPADDIAS